MISKRGVEALGCVAEGFNLDRTADKMCISRSTVEKHLFKIKHQLNAKNLMSAVYIAAKSGLIIALIQVSSVNHYDTDFDRKRVLPRKRQQEVFLLVAPVT